jgi:hypothetical protein
MESVTSGIVILQLIQAGIAHVTQSQILQICNLCESF